MTAWIVEHFGLGLSLAVMTRCVRSHKGYNEQYLRAIWRIEKTQSVRLGPRQRKHVMRYAIDQTCLNAVRWMARRYGLIQEDFAPLDWDHRRWLDAVWNKVWTETGEAVAAHWPPEMLCSG